MPTPGHANPRVVDTYGILTKLYLLGSVLRRMRRARRTVGAAPDQFPGTVQVQTRTGCNSHCVLCPQDAVTAMFPQETMPRHLYDRIAGEAASDVRVKGFAPVLQNEPLLDPDLPDKIRYFQSRNRHGAIVFIVTNGMLLVPETVHALLDAGLDMMHVSVNGYQREDYEALNRGRSFAVLQDNLEYLLAQDLSKLGLQLSFIMNAKYAAELRAAVKAYRRRGLRVHVHGISNRGGLVDERLMEEYRPAARLDSLRNRLLKPLAKRLLPCCPYPFFQCSILANGQVLLCTHDWRRRSIIGDLNRQSIREVWNGARVAEIRRLFLEGRMKEVPACADCNVYDELGFV